MSENTSVDILLHMYQESMALARQAEDQRISMTNFAVTIAAAVLAFIVQAQFSRNTLPLSLFVTVLGLFGIVTSIKFAQHYHRHYSEAKHIRQRLDELSPDARIQTIFEQTTQINQERYPIIGGRINTLSLWTALHGSIMLIGIGCGIVTMIK